MKKLMLVVFCVVAIAAAACVQSEDQSAPGGAVLVTLELNDTWLQEAIDKLMDQSGGSSYVISPEAKVQTHKTKVNLSLRNMPFEDALDALTKPNGLTWQKDSATGYSIRLPDTQLVTLDLKDTPLMDAFEALFTGTGLSYVFESESPDAAQAEMQALENIKVSASLKDVPFMDALRVLLKSTNLVYKTNGNMFLFSGKSTQANLDTQAKEAKLDGLVTMRIPPMSVRDALAMIETGWTFKDNLGDTSMPGVSFYQFPKDMAAGMVLISAGLVPPAGGRKIVTAKGKADLSTFYQWSPKQTGSYGSYGRGYGSAIPSAGGLVLGSGFNSGAMSIGCYKKSEGEWRYTVLTSGAKDTDLLQALFITGGTSFVIGDLLPTGYPAGYPRGPRIANAVSLQLFDVTLDDALRVILPTVGLVYQYKDRTYHISAKTSDGV